MQDSHGSELPRILAALSPTYHAGYEGRKRALILGKRPADARKPKKRRARWQRKPEGWQAKNVVKIARQYDEYLSQPDVLGYRDVADHFGVTKPTVSYYLALLRRLPEDFIEWLEVCVDQQVLAFFSQKRLRPITRIEPSLQRAALLSEAEQLASDLEERPDAVTALLLLLGNDDRPAPKPREHRAIQLD